MAWERLKDRFFGGAMDGNVMLHGMGGEERRCISLKELNPFVTCGLCQGYLHSAVTITECLHTFCKGCLVHHINFNLKCPKCSILIHPTDPSVNIRHDATIQDILYKVLPQVEQEEMRREREFYRSQHIDFPPLETRSVAVSLSQLQTAQLPPAAVRRKDSTGAPDSADIARGHSTPVTLVDGAVLDPAPQTLPTTLRTVELLYGGCSPEADVKESIQALLWKYLLVPGNMQIANLESYLYKKLHLERNFHQIGVFADAYLLRDSLTVDQIAEVFYVGKKVLTLQYAILPRRDFFIDYHEEESEEEEDENSSGEEYCAKGRPRKAK